MTCLPPRTVPREHRAVRRQDGAIARETWSPPISSPEAERHGERRQATAIARETGIPPLSSPDAALNRDERHRGEPYEMRASSPGIEDRSTECEQRERESPGRRQHWLTS